MSKFGLGFRIECEMGGKSLVVVAQNESARTNLLKSKIDRSQELLILQFLEMRGLSTKRRNPAENYMFKVKNRNTRSRREYVQS